MNFDDLAPELLEKAKACKTADEFAELAKEAGLELSGEDLAGVAGGRVDTLDTDLLGHCNRVSVK